MNTATIRLFKKVRVDLRIRIDLVLTLHPTARRPDSAAWASFSPVAMDTATIQIFEKVS